MSDTADGPLTPERLAEMRGVYERYWGGAARNKWRKDFVLALIAEVEHLRADALTAEEAETILLFRWNSPRREVALTDKLQRIAHPAAGQ